jgi:hypothetical protein
MIMCQKWLKDTGGGAWAAMKVCEQPGKEIRLAFT